MVLGMRYDSSFNYAMAGLYRTAVAVSALIILLSVSVVYAADPPVPRGNVSATLNPTTGYYSTTNSTLRLPSGVSVSPSAGGPPVVTKYSGGLKQSIPTGITIDAIKKSAPLPVAVRAGTPSLKSAAKGLFRGNLAGLVLGAGLNSLLDGIGALIDDAGNIVMLPPDGSLVYDPPISGSFSASNNHFGGSHLGFPSAAAACAVTTGCVLNGSCSPRATSPTYGYCWGTKAQGHYGRDPVLVCPSGEPTDLGCLSDGNYAPPPAGFLDDAIDSSYNPEPSDWTNLTPHLDLDDVEITSAPTLQGEPKTTTVFDADGIPRKVTETNIWYDFDIRDNPSPRPALDLKTREETKTYEDGELTSTTTTTSGASAGSNDAPPPPESLIDCDLFPTACAWFDWTQEEPTEPDDDLSGLLQEVPIVSETFTITGGVAACPAPMVLDLSVFGSREVSYQPLCDLASTMKYLYLALMSFAAAVLLNRSVNRV